ARAARATLVRRLTLAAAGALGLGLALILGPGALRPPAIAAGAPPFAIRTQPVSIAADRITGLRPLGAWVLSADAPGFGGFSGLVVADGMLTAVSDRAGLLTARFADSAGGPVFSEARLVALRDSDGSDPGAEGGDAEALVSFGGMLLAAFEHDHRLAPLSPDGVIGAPITLPAFETLPANGGIEALAASGGMLLAIPETPSGGSFPVYALTPDGRATGQGRLPAPPPHAVTDATIGPDGLLYVSLRDFSMATGVSIRIRRHALSGEPPLPVEGPGETLAAYEHASGIDNIEAIALWRDAQGRLRLWLMSDDNFNPLQRTLLLDFEVTG
ncbi:MAG: esterase-like activity of phytase family protein, partial [Thermohalobaculum sp.]|nr:esterase-like activity of phytase family protein [Thermohalobaculum sp.]